MTQQTPKIVPFPAKAQAPEVEKPAEVVIPEDLQSKVQSIRAFATVHNILAASQFPVHMFGPVAESLQFLKAVHGQAIVQAAEHPNAMDVPELKAYLDAANSAGKEPTDGTPSQN